MVPYPVIDTQLDSGIYNFEWFYGDAPDNANAIASENGAALTVKEVGTYWVRAIDQRTGCDIFKSTKVIGSFVPKAISVERTSDTFSRSNILEIAVEGNGEYEYRLDNGDFQDSNVFRNVLLGERTLTVRDIYGCGSISQQFIVIDYHDFSPLMETASMTPGILLESDY